MRIGESTKAAVHCILRRVHAHVALNYIIIDLELSPRQTLPVHPAYADRDESDCVNQGYYVCPLSASLVSWAETSPTTVNGGSV